MSKTAQKPQADMMQIASWFDLVSNKSHCAGESGIAASVTYEPMRASRRSCVSCLTLGNVGITVCQSETDLYGMVGSLSMYLPGNKQEFLNEHCLASHL